MELIFLKPYCREVVWGGTRLASEYGYETEGDHTGEAWVVSANKAGPSVVTGGDFDGWKLDRLWEERGDLFGGHGNVPFPLLVKLIDARQHLSIQVHPDNAYAETHENGAQGKNECWYILDCSENADIVIGHHAESRKELEEMIRAERWEELLSVYSIHKGDFFFIPSGTVHAIRGGTLLLEIQQNSDVTYRLYDYGRLENGKPRKLQREKGLDVIRCPQFLVDTQEALVHYNEAESRVLVRCPFFTVQHWKIDGGQKILQTQPFLIVDVLEGEGIVNDRHICRGDHFISTCGSDSLNFKGKLELMVSWTTGC